MSCSLLQPSRAVGDEHDEVLEMPTLLLGDHVVKGRPRQLGMSQPSFGSSE